MFHKKAAYANVHKSPSTLVGAGKAAKSTPDASKVFITAGSNVTIRVRALFPSSRNMKALGVTRRPATRSGATVSRLRNVVKDSSVVRDFVKAMYLVIPKVTNAIDIWNQNFLCFTSADKFAISLVPLLLFALALSFLLPFLGPPPKTFKTAPTAEATPKAIFKEFSLITTTVSIIILLINPSGPGFMGEGSGGFMMELYNLKDSPDLIMTFG